MGISIHSKEISPLLSWMKLLPWLGTNRVSAFDASATISAFDCLVSLDMPSRPSVAKTTRSTGSFCKYLSMAEVVVKPDLADFLIRTPNCSNTASRGLPFSKRFHRSNVLRTAGGILGGPIGKWLISKNNLQSGSNDESQTQQTHNEETAESLQHTLAVILVLAICVEVGHLVNQLLFAEGVLIPGFLTSMFVGIIITNLADVFKVQLHSAAVDRASNLSLNIFLSMSLMSMHLWVLAGGATAVMIVLFVQMLIIALFASLIVFRAMGRDYDAAVISSGFVGLGLGATPVAIANMTAITSRFGYSVKAFLVVPLVGAFFIDILNAAVIKFYINVITKWFS